MNQTYEADAPDGLTAGVKKETLSESRSQALAEIDPAHGKLGVMMPGMGAVSTTFVAGVEAVRQGLASPVGSLTQMGTIRLGKRTEGQETSRS